MNLEDNDEVVGMQMTTQGDYLLIVSENGMKMLGEGLSLEQKSFSIEIGREIRVSGESVRGPASFSETEELEGYRLAVCEDGIAAELKLIFRSPEDL